MPSVFLLPPIQFREFDANGNPLAGGKVYTYEAGTTTPKTSYTDSTGTTPNTNPVILDSSGAADIWISGTYKIRVTDASDVLIREEDGINNDQGSQGPSGTFRMSVAGGTADAITAAYSPTISLTDLTTVGFRAINTNATTTPTFAPDGLAAKTITKHNGDALLSGDIIAGAHYIVTFDSSADKWKIISSSASRGIVLKQVNNGITHAAPTSTVTPYTIIWPAAQGAALTYPQNDGSGNLTWTASPTKFNLIATVGVSSAAQIDVTSQIANWQLYNKMIFYYPFILPSTAGANLNLSVSNNGGGGWTGTSIQGTRHSGSASADYTTNIVPDVENGATDATDLTVEVSIGLGTAGGTLVRGRFYGNYTKDGDSTFYDIGGSWKASSTVTVVNINGLRLALSSGTFSQTVYVYGLLN